MLNADAWIETRVAAARASKPAVTEAASEKIMQLLKGSFGSDAQSGKELATLAQQLIEDMRAPAENSKT